MALWCVGESGVLRRCPSLASHPSKRQPQAAAVALSLPFMGTVSSEAPRAKEDGWGRVDHPTRPVSFPRVPHPPLAALEDILPGGKRRGSSERDFVVQV